MDNPDTYIGSVENVESQLYIFDENTNKINEITFMFNPGLFKLFDEGIVNCRDHVIRMNEKFKSDDSIQKVTQINIEIKDGIISMMNNGNGIDIVKHPEYNVWIPELIFRTFENFNKL